MIWVAGQIVPDDALRISVLDRTFEHGLGLFETFRTWNGRATLLDRHLARLQDSAEALRLPLDPAALPDASAVACLLRAEQRPGDAMLRLTLSGGLSESAGSVAWLRSQDLPPPGQEKGVRVAISPSVRVDPGDPLAGHKTLNYWRRRLAHEGARAAGLDECIITSPEGWLLEGTRTSLFLVREGMLTTHPLDGHLLPGIMRQVVLERAGSVGIATRLQPSTADDLELFDEAFLTNAVRGIMPIAIFGHKTWSAPGPITRRLRDDLGSWLASGGETR